MNEKLRSYQVRITYETTKLYLVEAEDEEKAQEIAEHRFDLGEPEDDPDDGWVTVSDVELSESATDPKKLKKK